MFQGGHNFLKFSSQHSISLWVYFSLNGCSFCLRLQGLCTYFCNTQESCEVFHSPQSVFDSLMSQHHFLLTPPLLTVPTLKKKNSNDHWRLHFITPKPNEACLFSLCKIIKATTKVHACIYNHLSNYYHFLPYTNLEKNSNDHWRLQFTTTK